MPLVKVRVTPTGEKNVYVAEEPISHLATVMIGSDARQIAKATTAGVIKSVGVAIGNAASGGIARVVDRGLVSGLICAFPINMGDRIIAANKTSGPGLASGPGLVVPDNLAVSGWIPNISGNVSGYIPHISGWLNLISGVGTQGGVVLDSTRLAGTSGNISGVGGLEIITQPIFSSGQFAVLTQPIFSSGLLAPVLGKALTSGGVGSGIQAVLTLGA